MALVHVEASPASNTSMFSDFFSGHHTTSADKGGGGSGALGAGPGDSSASSSAEEDANSLTIALGANSADCVQHLLDAVMQGKVGEWVLGTGDEG